MRACANIDHASEALGRQKERRPAEYEDVSVGDLLEGIVLHAFDGKAPFSAETLRRIRDLKEIYGLDLDASASHRMRDKRWPTWRTWHSSRSEWWSAVTAAAGWGLRQWRRGGSR